MIVPKSDREFERKLALTADRGYEIQVYMYFFAFI